MTTQKAICQRELILKKRAAKRHKMIKIMFFITFIDNTGLPTKNEKWKDDPKLKKFSIRSQD